MSSFHMDMCIWQRFNRHTSNLLFLKKTMWIAFCIYCKNDKSYESAWGWRWEKDATTHTHLHYFHFELLWENFMNNSQSVNLLFAISGRNLAFAWLFFSRLFRMMRRIVNCNCICPLTQSHDLVAHSSFKILINL